MTNRSAMDRLTQQQPNSGVKSDEWAALLDGLRASAVKQRQSLDHGKRLAKRDGVEWPFLNHAGSALEVVEKYIESCDGPATAAKIFDALMDVAHMLGVAAGMRGGLTRAAREKKRKGHEESKQGKAKVGVQEWWKRWRDGEISYEGSTDFARAMLDKYDGILISIGVITRWVREWDREAIEKGKK